MHWSSDAGSMGYIVMKDTLSGKVSKLLRMEGAGVIGAYHGLVNAQLVSTAHRAGKKLFVWTVDDESAMTQMLRARVDGIVTSLPNLLQQVMNAERQQCSINGFS